MKKKLLALFLCCALSFGLVTAALITPAAADEDFLVYGSDGLVAHTVELAKNNKLALTAVASTGSGVYQWQIQVGGDVWANISGANGVTLDVSYALVANLLYGGAANLRCRLTAGETVKYTNTVTVQITDETPVSAPAQAPKAPTVISEAEPVGEPVIIPPQTAVEETPAPDAAPAADAAPAPDAAPANDLTANVAPAALADPAPVNDPAPTENGGEEPYAQTFTITISYVDNKDQQVADPWTATVMAGSTYQSVIKSPVVVGYTAEQTEITVGGENIQADQNFTVKYTPAVVKFSVKHLLQNVSNDEYTQDGDPEIRNGNTGDEVGETLEKQYPGFYSLKYDATVKIAGDESTVVEVKYDRYYYLINFNLDGGYGVEPIYARYGAPVNVGNPQKPGYTFTGWSGEIPKTMPVIENPLSFTANWEKGTAGFTVVFWYEKANDVGYSVAGTFTPADVAPGTQKSSGDYQNQSFEGRDDKHFTYNADKAETVTVNGDGSTVLNVYYTRNTYTLTFKEGGAKVLSCGKVEHKHSDSCCKYGGTGLDHWYHRDSCCKLGLSEHTHSNKCYKYSDLTITAKYGADIHSNFPIKDGNETIWWKVPDGCQSFVPGNNLGTIDTMPGENITFEKDASESGAKIYYYVETLNGAAGDTTLNGKNYKQYKVVDLTYSSSTSLTYAEEFHPITGFTQGDSNPYLPKDGKVRMKQNNYLYYTRNSYELSFYNYNAVVDGKGGSVQYEAPLSSYSFEPEYPDKLEKNAYVFDGWYTTSGCYEGSKADLSTLTMPASDLVLYAKWVPKTHTVKTYLTKDVLDNNGEAIQTWTEVPHGTAVTDPPANPERKPYTFVGWFYISDTDEEKAFDFSMPVNRDLNLYAKWRADVNVDYVIHYRLKDGTTIAEDTTGSALAGTTKTFAAKTFGMLNEGYQTGYYPLEGSHSIQMDIEGTNEYTFVYVAREKVNYTVRYLERNTETVLYAEKSGETSDAVITEKFVQIPGYAPDAYQKQLVLSADDTKNVLTFWYTKDETHAPLQILHLIQNLTNDEYTEYQSSTNLNATIGTDYSESPLTLTGFTYNEGKSTASGKLSADGLVLTLYYDRNVYPYEFRFLVQGTTETKVADPVTGNARYQARVTQGAKEVPGYTLVLGTTNPQTIDIVAEEGNTAVNNVKIFYYVEDTVDIKYEVVGPQGCGSLDNYQDNTVKVIDGAVIGSTPTASAGFKFVGWFKDEACTETGKVEASWIGADNKLTPGKTKNYGTEETTAMGYEAATYYAKFEADVADLSITKQGYQEIDGKQSFIFTVTGPDGFSKKIVIQGNGTVVLTGLKIGEYTVTEDTAWSWRYTPKGGAVQKIELQPGITNTVNYMNDRTNDKWLDGNAYCKNVFGTIAETDSGN